MTPNTKYRPKPITVRYADGTTTVVKSNYFRKEPFNFAKYRKSRRWKILRGKAFRRDGYRCQICKTRKRLQMHHLTYERLGNERLEDLVTLCFRCRKAEQAWRMRRGEHVPEGM